MSSPSKMPLITLLFALLFVDSSIAGYVLEDDYTPSNFFSMFSFFTSTDPTSGFVDYVDQSTAQSAGYISTTSDTVYIGTDHENNTPSGRPSVRLTSNKAYNVGSLVILDLEHMPGGICGTWPAFWMVGPDWPAGGEIDILEGVNEQTANAMTLHTDAGCSITNDGNFTGTISTYNCDVDASGQSANAGCSIDSSDNQTYGSGFNSIGGGVYATEWTNSSISIWFFPRGSIPADITAGSPVPSSAWGTPAAQFQGGCDIPEYFQDNQLVFDLTFCGDWAGEVWSSSSCSSKADTCVDYVQNNPSAFEDAYWTINSLQVFQYSASASDSTTSAVASTSSYALSTYPVVVSSSKTSSLATSSSQAEATSSSTPFSAYPSISSSASSSGYSSSSFPAYPSISSSASSSGYSSSSFAAYPSISSSASSSGYSSSFSASPTSSPLTSSSLSSSESPSSTSSNGWWNSWHTTATASSAIPSEMDSTSFASLSATFAGKVVSIATDVATASSSADSTISSSDSTTASSVSQTSATILSVQTSSTTPGTSTVASIASTIAMSTSLSSAAGSVSSAVPTSQAELLAKVKALAEEWATTEPVNWRDEINAIEEAMEAASSQAAAVSAKLSANQRRHLLQHKRRFGGHL